MQLMFGTVQINGGKIMFNFIIRMTHENGAVLSTSVMAESFTEALAAFPMGNVITLSVVRSPICR